MKIGLNMLQEVTTLGGLQAVHGLSDTEHISHLAHREGHAFYQTACDRQDPATYRFEDGVGDSDCARAAGWAVHRRLMTPRAVHAAMASYDGTHEPVARGLRVTVTDLRTYIASLTDADRATMLRLVFQR